MKVKVIITTTGKTVTVTATGTKGTITTTKEIEDYDTDNFSYGKKGDEEFETVFAILDILHRQNTKHWRRGLSDYISGQKILNIVFTQWKKDRFATEDYAGKYEFIADNQLISICPFLQIGYDPVKNTLNGNPFIGEQIDWAQKYKAHMAGPNSHISYSPKEGITLRDCGTCFYRYGKKHVDCQIGENGDLGKKAFGIPKYEFMPLEIAGKNVGHFCPHFTDPMAE